MKNLNCNQINIFIYLKIIGEKIRTNFFLNLKKKILLCTFIFVFIYYKSFVLFDLHS